MIFLAFGVPQYQRLDPAFAGSGRVYDQVYEVVGAIPKQVAEKRDTPPKSNSEQWAMLRNLLADRFKLAYHYEKREIKGYSLTANQSGFKPKSDPDSKPIGAPKDYVPPAGSVSPRWHAPAEGWLDVTRASMDQFAAGLSKWAFQGLPITDETGLKGIYSFTLHYESHGFSSSVATTEAADPWPTIFQALGQQGLKLTPKKMMADFLVIDHVDASPTGN